MNLTLPLSTFSKLIFQSWLKCRTLLPKQRSSSFGKVSSKERPKIDHIYLINLDRQKDRLTGLKQELRHVLDSSGIELWKLTERYPAIDATHFLEEPQKDATVDPIFTLREQLYVEPQPLTLPNKVELDTPINMSRPEVAIAFSHIEIWKLIKENNFEHVLILEDDVRFCSDFAQRLDQAWKEIYSHEKNKEYFDILYLSYEEVKHGAPKIYVSKNLFSPERGLWYLSGYVVSKKGAEKLLDLLPCRGPVDLWINHQFKKLEVVAIRKPVIFQRRDFGSTNSYSILPILTKIGAINSESASLFHIRPNTSPVFAFGTKDSGLSSLATALLMLGYRCCSDLQNLPDAESQAVLKGNRSRIFDAYVNVGCLLNEIHTLKKRYPLAKFIITKSEVEDLKDAFDLKDLDYVILNLEAGNKWQIICEHLRCAPPACSFPKISDLGKRKLKSKSEVDCSILKCKIPKRDVSPWVIEQNNYWQGIHTALTKSQLETIEKYGNFNDNLIFLDPLSWKIRDDTFTDNMALFRPSNIKLHTEFGAILTLKKEQLGVRNYSAAALTSNNQYTFGRFEAVIKASKAPGVITGLFLHRDSPRQEIDIEIAGNRLNQLLINVFFNPGDSGTKFDYGYRGSPSIIDLGFDASEDYHLYSIEWNPNSISWYVDNCLVHRRVEWDPTPIPHLPMAFHINIWPTRSKELAGTIKSSKLPTSTYIKSISLNTNHPTQ